MLQLAVSDDCRSDNSVSKSILYTSKKPNLPLHFLLLEHNLYWHALIRSAKRKEVNFCAIVKSVHEKNFFMKLQLGSTTDLNEIAMTITCSTQLRKESIPKQGDVIIVLHADLIVDERFRITASLRFHSPEP